MFVTTDLRLSSRGARLLGLLVLIVAIAAPAAAQRGRIEGIARSADRHEPIASVRIVVLGTGQSVFTDRTGTFVLSLAAGSHELRITRVGFRPRVETVRVTAGGLERVRVELEPLPVQLSGIELSVLRPDLRPQAELEQQAVREANPRDAGELLRSVPGVAAVRRGPVGLDPVVRGLRETEVGVYLDGTRMFPAGPARMDSPMSHFDPSAVRSIEVVKGPYALTWGAGNLSAIRVETEPIPSSQPGIVHGSFQSGYDQNYDAQEVAGSLYGSASDRVAYWVHGAWRQGDDYAAGDGSIVPADFVSGEGRAKLAFRLAPGSRLTLAGGYQQQGSLDYPGRLLDAELFHTLNLSANWRLIRPEHTVRAVEILGYINNVDHRMNNDAKPTALDAAATGRNPTPPFALDVGVEAEIDVAGARAAAQVAADEHTVVELGADVYRARRDAVRTIARRASAFSGGPPAGTVLFEDAMWPDATIWDAGLFARSTHTVGRGVSLAATGRLDLVRADATQVSQFFSDNVSSNVEQSEANVSGAVTLSAIVSPNWTVSAGVGSAVRTADASERYSDRIPASKAQTSAEFVGDPSLAPERSTQGDLWIEAAYPRVSLQANLFARRIANYITLTPTTLPARLPLSPPTVFQFVNGEADFWGFEVSSAVALADPLVLGLLTSYLHGKDTALDEPALGISPFEVAGSLRYEERDGPFYVEGAVRAVARQNRVAASRGEIPTDDYVILDLKAGVRPRRGLEFRGGILNLTDRHYSDHLNAQNPFSGIPVPEPGRVFFLDASYAF